jgi:hypothetical protein
VQDLERHYRFHLRRMALGLAFSLAMAVTAIVFLLRPGMQLGLLLAPAVVFVGATVGLNIVLRGWTWPRNTPTTCVARDEWVQANVNRSRRVSLQTIYAVQVPLMFLVAYVPTVPTVSMSVVGMALLTMASGSIAFFSSYLLHSRQHVDG